MALHKPCALTTRPGYSHCTDRDDPSQLTHGAYTSFHAPGTGTG